MSKVFIFRFTMLLVLLGLATKGEAATQTLDAAYSGAYWTYESGYTHSVGSDLLDFYSTGRLGQEEFRGYMLFNLTGVTGTITGASLQAFNPINGFQSIDASESVRISGLLWDQSIVNEVRTSTGAGTSYVWGYLGGTLLSSSYGAGNVSSADNDSLVTFGFNSSAVSAMNGPAGGYGNEKWLLAGFSITTLNEKPEMGSAPQEYIFNQTDFDTYARRLVLTTTPPVPEVSTWMMMGTGLIFLGVHLNRRSGRFPIGVSTTGISPMGISRA